MTDAIGYCAACAVAGYIGGTLTGYLLIWAALHRMGWRVVIDDGPQR